MNMSHWRKMFDGKYIGAWDLVDGQDRPVDKTLTIESVRKATIESKQGKAGKPIVTFQGIRRPLVLNVTMCKTLETLYGADPDEWVGKRVTLYSTTTNTADGEVPCVRIRPRAPAAKDKEGKITEPAPSEPAEDRLPGEEG